MLVPKPRIIRSYIRRERRSHPLDQGPIAALWQRYGLEIETGMIERPATFCILEIGFGMGHSLIQQASEHPDWNFLGIEVHRPGVAALLNAAAAQQLQNIHVYCDDAIEVLTRCIPDNSFDKVQLFFPDPWPKRRHHKRRLVQHAFVELIRQKLKPQGIFHLATDWQHYADHMLKVLSTAPGFSVAAKNDRPLTKFELRAQREDRQVWDFFFMKIP